MEKVKLILKAFVVIAVIPILLISGIAAMAFVAPIFFDDLSHPLFQIIALPLLLPWGFVFAVVFFTGIGLVPNIVVIPTGHQGGYSISDGYGRGGGGIVLILKIIMLVLAIPVALLIWLVVSIILLFSEKLREKINDLYEKFVCNLKTWWKLGLALFVIAPLVVVGINALENKLYSPSGITVECTDFYLKDTYDEYSVYIDGYQTIKSYHFEYSFNAGGKDVLGFSGEWEFINKDTGESFSMDPDSFFPFGWYWQNEDKNTDHSFNTTVAIPAQSEEYEKIFSHGIDNIEIRCNITYISFKSNIPIFGDWMFPSIDNEFKDGYAIEVTKAEKMNVTSESELEKIDPIGKDVREQFDKALKAYKSVDVSSDTFKEDITNVALMLDDVWEDVAKTDVLLEEFYAEAEKYKNNAEYEKAYFFYGLLARLEYKDSLEQAQICYDLGNVG